MKHEPDDVFASADWYDRSINWRNRFDRELPILIEVFGAPGSGGLIDAGCGTGRHTIALSELGYGTIGVDSSREMLDIAERLRDQEGTKSTATFVHARYGELVEKVDGDRDGVFCLGNALAAAGSRDDAETAIRAFAQCLRQGGRCVLQLLNFAVMRQENPCVRGPRVAAIDGVEYISFRQFHFSKDHVEVVNVTMWQDGEWRKHARGGTLYPVELPELSAWCDSAGLRLDTVWGSYHRDPFDVSASNDLIVVATRH